MMTLLRTALLAAALCLPGAAAISQELPSRDDYAYSFPLSIENDSEFFESDLPLQVYRSVSDSALRDAGVYNSQQQPVPRLFEQPPVPDNKEESIRLDPVPLNTNLSEQPEQLRLLLQQAGRGITMQLDSSEANIPDSGNSIAAYIIDARELQHDLVALQLQWPKQAQGFIGRLLVEHGNDLQNWRRLGETSLADLEYSNTHIVQNRVDLVEDAFDFLRISWQNLPDTFQLDSVTGIYTMAGVPEKRDELILSPVSDTLENAREFVFDIDGFPPVDRINLLLKDENVVVKATIFSRMGEKDGWKRRHGGIFYKLSRQGSSLRSPPARVTPTRDSQWKVKLESGVTSTPVQLQLGWKPDRLVFLAQGAPPFELVSGRAKDRLEGFPQDRILGDRSIFKILTESGQPGSAAIGSRKLRGGVQQLEVSTTNSWRTSLLWAGLVAAVLLVGWLVYSLIRELRKEGHGGE